MPTKRLQVRVNGSKYGSGIPPRRAFCGRPPTVGYIGVCDQEEGVIEYFCRQRTCSSVRGSSASAIECEPFTGWYLVQGRGLRIWGSGFGVQGAGFRVQGSGFRVQGAGLRVEGSGFRVQGSGLRVQGSGMREQGAGCGVEGSGFRVEG